MPYLRISGDATIAKDMTAAEFFADLTISDPTVGKGANQVSIGQPKERYLEDANGNRVTELKAGQKVVFFNVWEVSDEIAKRLGIQNVGKP
jgi:hypothetical protein